MGQKMCLIKTDTLRNDEGVPIGAPFFVSAIQSGKGEAQIFPCQLER